MRKLVWMVAALALAGCGEGKSVDVQKPKTAVAAAPAAASAPQWDLEVRGETPQAVSDLSGWLIEHAFVPTVLIRAPRLDRFRINAEPDKPYRQAR